MKQEWKPDSPLRIFLWATIVVCVAIIVTIFAIDGEKMRRADQEANRFLQEKQRESERERERTRQTR